MSEEEGGARPCSIYAKAVFVSSPPSLSPSSSSCITRANFNTERADADGRAFPPRRPPSFVNGARQFRNDDRSDVSII